MNELVELNQLSSQSSIQQVITSLERLYIKYSAAIKELETKIQILSEDFLSNGSYTPIEHVKSRIKTPESIINKLIKYGYPITIGNIVQNINDVAGIRIVCSFLSDIYTIADLITKNSDIHVLEIKDYIQHPKPSGYNSYHMIVSVPIFLTTGKEYVKVEIQIRTSGMDFWASTEHKIRYKFNGVIPEDVNEELRNCARMVGELDNKLSHLSDVVKSYNQES